MVCTGCCSVLVWTTVTYLFKQLSRTGKKRGAPPPQESKRFLHIMQQHPEMFPADALHCSQYHNIFEDCRNQWSMSRPLLGFILLNERSIFRTYGAALLVASPSLRNNKPCVYALSI
ncbi:exportin-7 [Pelobates cultripes]|uniref:Exportin-7 n=1 Tax=Pelobates cultripes TaxID=61616 RepID=A0AAD1TB76_PELCU|nr:exportin-7 [Pelobates cultripes]